MSQNSSVGAANLVKMVTQSPCLGNIITMMGFKHTNQFTEIPSPIKEVLGAINAKYLNEKLNFCLVNKYHGPQSYLPNHADDEPTIAPNSVIYTVSLGHSCTVTLISHELIAEPNSLYVMTRTSQADIGSTKLTLSLHCHKIPLDTVSPSDIG